MGGGTTLRTIGPAGWRASSAALALPAQAQTTDNFYLRRTTITVGEDSGYLGYDSDPNSLLGSISTGAKFNYPPFNPPPKHHFDPDYNATVQGLYLSSSGDDDVLTLQIVDDGKNIISLRPGTSRSGSATRASG